jgi:hypothetical protein
MRVDQGFVDKTERLRSTTIYPDQCTTRFDSVFKDSKIRIQIATLPRGLVFKFFGP